MGLPLTARAAIPASLTPESILCYLNPSSVASYLSGKYEHDNKVHLRTSYTSMYSLKFCYYVIRGIATILFL